MPNSKDLSVEDEAYLATIAAEPKMTMDEVGADIEEHGHVPVTPETATQDPFTAKGSLAYALDEALSADTDLEKTIMTRDKNDHLDSHLTNPTDDFRDETKGEVEGTTSTPQGLIQPVESNKVGEGLEPTIQQDKAVQVKDSLAEALDAITMDGAEEIEAKPPIGKDPEPDLSKYNEEEASHIPLKAPKIPPSLGGAEDTPDANGLVYVSATFTVDPDKYVSNNYRPTNMGKMPDAVAELKKASGAMKKQAANPEEEAALSDLGTPEAKESAASPDEPTPQQEEAAAKDADKEQKEDIEVEVKEEAASAIPTPKKDDKPAQDEAPEKEVLDYATFIDGSSFICFDEVAGIDYSKIAMDAGPKKAPTRANCQTTFAQCRAKNPLFCRFHGPKLLEADIKTAIKATVGPGCVVQVTKDKNSKNKFTFRLTVGCPPSKKKMVEKMVHMYLTQNPGITSSTEDWNLVGKHKQTQEFEMDILQADKPPKKDTKADQMLSNTKKAIKEHKKQDVVGETAPGLEKKAAKGEKWQTVDEDIENEWADLVDKTVHKSLLGNNEEFLANFNKIANQFDAAHDAGDANGLKQALEALKEEIGKYDENGEKKAEAATGEAEETTEEPAAPEAPQEQAEESKVEKPVSKPAVSSVEQPSNDDEAEFDKLVNEAEEKGLFDNDDFQKKYQQIFFDGKSDMPAKVAAMKELMGSVGKGGGSGNTTEGMEDAGSGGSEEVVLPAPPVLSKGNEGSESNPLQDLMDEANEKNLFGDPDFASDYDKIFKTNINSYSTLGDKIEAFKKLIADYSPKPKGSESTTSVPESDGAPSYGGNAISSLQNELSGLMDKMQSIGATTDADVAAMLGHCNLYMDDLKTAKDSLIEIENSIKSNSEDSTTNDLGKSFNMVLLDAAKKQAKEKIDEKIEGVKVAIEQFNESLQSYEKAKIETTKKGVADSVEETIKNLGVSIFGGKRPPQGVDSVVDYLDYLKDELESGAEENITPDEMAGIEDQYHLEDYYKSTKAASKALDDAIEAFKDKMDEAPSQGEDSGTYQAEIEQMQKAIGEQASEVLTNFNAYKNALGHCKYEADAAKKLADSKKKLEGVEGAGGESSLGEPTAEDWEKASKEILTMYGGATGLGSPKALEKAEFVTKTKSFPLSKGNQQIYKKNLSHLAVAFGTDSPIVQAMLKAYKNHSGYDMSGLEQYELAPSSSVTTAETSQGGGEVTKEDIEDFFGQKFDESKPVESQALNLWLELAHKGTWGGDSPKNHFSSSRGWMQDKMKEKGMNHPMTKALIKAGLPPPKGMEQQVQGNQGGEGKKPIEGFDFDAWQKAQDNQDGEESKQSAQPSQQAQQKTTLTDEEKKAKIAAMSPKQKLEAAVKIFKKKLAANPNDETAKAKLSKYEAMLAKLGK